MAARVCSVCDLAIPQSESKHNVCPVCEGTFRADYSRDADRDWQEQVERAKVDAHVRAHESERVEVWRLRSALALGVPVELAEEYALSHGDRQQLADLIAAGCAPATAARIVI